MTITQNILKDTQYKFLTIKISVCYNYEMLDISLTVISTRHTIVKEKETKAFHYKQSTNHKRKTAREKGTKKQQNRKQ